MATLPSLDPSGHEPRPDLTFIGPVVPAARTGRVSRAADGRRCWSASAPTGSPAWPEPAAHPRRLRGLDARVVVTTGPVIDPAALRAPDNAEVHRFVPHADLMPSVSLVIGHGGHGTTMQALAHDLPLVLMPMHPMLDQPLVGRSVEQAGAGAWCRRRRPSGRLRPVIAGAAGRRPPPGARPPRLGARSGPPRVRPPAPTGSRALLETESASIAGARSPRGSTGPTVVHAARARSRQLDATRRGRASSAARAPRPARRRRRRAGLGVRRLDHAARPPCGRP